MSNAADLRKELRSTRWRLEQEQETIAEIERVCERHGYDGNRDCDPLAEWLDARLRPGGVELSPDEASPVLDALVQSSDPRLEPVIARLRKYVRR